MQVGTEAEVGLPLRGKERRHEDEVNRCPPCRSRGDDVARSTGDVGYKATLCHLAMSSYLRHGLVSCRQPTRLIHWPTHRSYSKFPYIGYQLHVTLSAPADVADADVLQRLRLTRIYANYELPTLFASSLSLPLSLFRHMAAES